MAISGNTIVVGADGEDSGATGVDGDELDNSANLSGAAYVFERNGSSWGQVAYLKASDTAERDRFGYAVHVSGDTIVVGAPEKTTGGAAYVFERTGSTWAPGETLVSTNLDTTDQFGTSVALSGDTLVVGARYEYSNATGLEGDQSDNSLIDAGAAYVFVRNGGSWSQQVYVKPSNTDGEWIFGFSVAVSDGRIAVGSPGQNRYTGGAYLFR